MRRATFSKVAWATLGYTIAVILWGAYVRASGSGAGCGSHWPTCHGEVLPRAPTTATVIELTHRVTSGLALLSVVVQLVLSRRTFASGHLARRAAGWSLFFMVTEALVGAGLVIFEKVAHDKSLARGWWMGAHLINTFMLIASMALVVFAASREGPAFARPKGRPALLLGAGLGALLLTGVSGAVAALGDTLFPADSFREGFAMDLHPEAHVFLQLRALHPFVAALTAVLLLYVGSSFARSGAEPATRRAAHALAGLVVLQVGVGLLNLLLAAPTAMQLVHLLFADAVWLATVALTACVATEAATSAARSHVEADVSEEVVLRGEVAPATLLADVERKA
ncbi:MAG: COX15/CtaA family protein [Polyangiaceae bacterium]|nr:COX15/CtaA family protein [Polyangiaceae bacterium]